MEQPEVVVAKNGVSDTPRKMTLNAGDPGYGSGATSAGPVLSGGMGGAETAPLLIPEQPESESEQVRWRPLSKEELELAAGGPGWRKIRSRLVLLFWLSWLAMLGTSVAIICKSPRPIAMPLQWWQKSLFYQLQPALFLDTQTDGPGGISVVCDHLGYLQSLGTGALILEGLFHKGVSPPELTVIDESVGTLPEIQHLVTESNKLGLKIVLDFCQLDLFGLEAQDAAGNHTDGIVVPSNHSDTVQYALRFWLEQGIAGFSVCDTDAAYSEQVLMDWRLVINEFSTEEEERIVVVKQTGEVLPALTTSSSINSSSINTTLVEVVMRAILPPRPLILSTQEVAAAIETHLQTSKGDIWPSWTVGGKASHDLQKLLLVLLMTLPGSPAVQYGEELTPTQNVTVKMDWSQRQDNETSKVMKDQERARYSALALFQSLSRSRAREEALLSGSFTFLPFNTSGLVVSEAASSSSNATLSPAPVVSSPPILAFLRSWGCVHFLVLLNLGSTPHALDPAWAPSLPQGGVFVACTGMDRLGATSLETLTVRPREAIVIKLFEAGSYS